jgi:hypothetical protein
VREDDFVGGHVPGAVNCPVDEFHTDEGIDAVMRFVGFDAAAVVCFGAHGSVSVCLLVMDETNPHQTNTNKTQGRGAPPGGQGARCLALHDVAAARPFCGARARGAPARARPYAAVGARHARGVSAVVAVGVSDGALATLFCKYTRFPAALFVAGEEFVMQNFLHTYPCRGCWNILAKSPNLKTASLKRRKKAYREGENLLKTRKNAARRHFCRRQLPLRARAHKQKTQLNTNKATSRRTGP